MIKLIPGTLVLSLALCSAACDSGNSTNDPADTVDSADEPQVSDGSGNSTEVDLVSDPYVVDEPDGFEDLIEDAPEDLGEIGPPAPPDALPFEFARPTAGEAPTEEEIAAFTRSITGFWRDVDYWRWVRMTSHGVDPSNTEGWPDYALWWQDTQAVRDGDTVTFRHVGRADNLTLRTSKVLTNAIAGYLMTGDEDMRWVVEQYCKGLAALAMAMEFVPDDPHRYLQARAIFTRNHQYETVGGRQVAIDYDPVRRDEEAWNAAIIHNPENPFWGDIWFVNQRSKDDVPHMYRVVPMLMRAAADAPDQSVRDAAELALEYLAGFARDIVDTDYQIRTRFDDGEPVVPTTEGGLVKDLASFVLYDQLVPNGECNGKLGSALVGYSEPLDNACESGNSDAYEHVATSTHYFNYAIVRYLHIAAVSNALMVGENAVAYELLEGLAERADRILHDETMPNRDEPVWMADAAAFLLAAASAGLPLTGEEARLVQEQYLLTAEHYRGFGAWDPWDEAIEDGPFDYKPHRGLAVRPTEIAYLLEYCFSPLRNPAGAPVVDCEIVADRARWGQ